jgi:hypothetical protein
MADWTAKTDALDAIHGIKPPDFSFWCHDVEHSQAGRSTFCAILCLRPAQWITPDL